MLLTKQSAILKCSKLKNQCLRKAVTLSKNIFAVAALSIREI